MKTVCNLVVGFGSFILHAIGYTLLLGMFSVALISVLFDKKPVHPHGIEPWPTEPESVILSIKLRVHVLKNGAKILQKK